MTKILVVDDAAHSRMRCANLLKPYGYEIIEAEDGAIAIEKYKTALPDLVIMDIIMPNMDGIESLKEIIKINHKAKIIILSNAGQDQMVLETIKAGAMAFIVKPFQHEKLLNEIKSILTK